MTPLALCVESLCLRLPDGRLIIDELSFRIEPGEVLTLMGQSGSGKSSVLAWLTGTLDRRIQAHGEVWQGERRLDTVPTERRHLGLMLQQDYLFPHMSVGDNLMFGLRGGDRAGRRRRVEESLAGAGLAGMTERDPATLSGGQRARVSLLRTLLSEPCALLLDEPFSRLDTALREQIRAFTWEAARELPVLLVTHDLADVPCGARIVTIGESGTEPARLVPQQSGG